MINSFYAICNQIRHILLYTFLRIFTLFRKISAYFFFFARIFRKFYTHFRTKIRDQKRLNLGTNRCGITEEELNFSPSEITAVEMFVPT